MALGTPAPIFSESDINPNEGFSFANQTTNSEAFGLSLARGLTSSANGVVNIANSFYGKNIAPGKTYTEDDWKNSEWFREGLSFDKLKGDNNTVSQYMAEISSRNKDQKDAFQIRLENMKPGFLASASKLTGDTLGFFLDPASIIGGGAAFKVGKILKNAKYIRAGLESATATERVASGVAFGAAEGITAVSAPATIDFVSQQSLGDDAASLRLLANLGLGLALGGAVRGFQGARRLVHPEADVAATQTAVSQLEAGKSVRTDEIIKDGLYREQVSRAKGSAEVGAVDTIDGELRDVVKEKLGTQVKNKLRNDINSQEAGIQDEIANVKTRTISSDIRKSTGAPEILKRLSSVNKIEKFNLTADQRLFLDRSFKTEELKKAKDILSKPGFQRTADDVIHLKKMSKKGGEEQLIQERLKNQETKVAELEEKIKTVEGEQKSTFKKELKIAKASSELGTERLNQLKSGIEDKRLADKHVKLQKTKRDLHEVDEIVTTQDMLDRFDNMDKPPVTPDELINGANEVRSFKNSASYNEREIGALENELRGAPKNEEQTLSDAEREFDTLSKDEVSQEERDLIDQVNDQVEQIERLSNTIPDVIKCILR